MLEGRPVDFAEGVARKEDGFVVLCCFCRRLHALRLRVIITYVIHMIYIYKNLYIYICINTCIYIYIERERERESEKKREKEG